MTTTRTRTTQRDRDLRTLARFVEVYCHDHHADAEAAPVRIKGCDLTEVLGRVPKLCVACQRLLTHAMVKRLHCPMDPKPSCKHCPNHCYHPRYRSQIREVMKYAGRKLVLRGRVDYLYHLFF